MHHPTLIGLHLGSNRIGDVGAAALGVRQRWRTHRAIPASSTRAFLLHDVPLTFV